MSKIIVNNSTIADIADAIREKTGENKVYTLSEMPEAIRSIETGGEGSGEVNMDDLFVYSCRYISNEDVQEILNYNLNRAYPPEVKVGGTCKSVRDYAFAGCDKLTSVNIPEGYTQIGNYAFHGCSNLTDIIIPEGVTYIGAYAFQECIRISELIIPSTVKNINTSALDLGGTINGTANYVDVYFKGTPTTINAYAFSFSNTLINNIYVPWAEGDVPYAPWGAGNATIHYNHVYEE